MIITDEGIRIELQFPEMVHRRVTGVKEIYLVLYRDYIVYKVVADYSCDNNDDDDNDEAIWKDTCANYRWTRMRSSISEVIMYFDNPESKWSVAMDFVGIDNATTWFFESPKDALKLYNQLQEYFITR